MLCEVKWNYQQIYDYLKGNTSHFSLPCHLHNAKNKRYQDIGGSSPASIGNYVMDPFFLKQVSLKNPGTLSRDLIRVKDWASDAAMLGLASAGVVEGILGLQSADRGNALVRAAANDVVPLVSICLTFVQATILALMFTRLSVLSVNGRVLSWYHRVVYSWSSICCLLCHITHQVAL